LAENRFFSSVVRIQVDRGHEVYTATKNLDSDLRGHLPKC
jgi:hypothetical protein